MAAKSNKNQNKNTEVVINKVPENETGEAAVTDNVETLDEPAVVQDENPAPQADDESDIAATVELLSGGTDLTEAAKVQVKRNKFDLTDKIPCKSLFHGKLVYTSPINGSRWVWNDYGAIQHIPLGELESMNNHSATRSSTTNAA